MAEQALIADLRIGLSKFDADLRKAMQAADRASANISKALDKVDDSVRTLPAEFNKVSQSLRQVEQATNRAAQASERQTQVMGRLKGALGSLGLLIGVREMLQFATSTVRASEAMVAVERQLTKVTGSVQSAKSEMAFIRTETDRLALSMVEGAKGFAMIANAAVGTVAQGEGVRRMFMAINNVTRANNLSTQQYGSLLTQMTQIISKGKAELDDLKIIAEAGVPVFQLLAKALNTDTSKIFKAISDGKIGVGEMLLLVEQMNKEYSDLAQQAATSIPAKFSRGIKQIFNEFTDLTQGILNSSKLINAFEFKSNILDIFPPKERITEVTDNILKEFLLLTNLIKAAFAGLYEGVLRILNAIGSAVKDAFTPIRDWVQKELRLLSEMPGLSFLGKMLPQSAKEGTDAANKELENLGNVEPKQGILAFLKTGGLNNILKSATEQINKWRGIDPPVILDPQKAAPAAQKAAKATEVPYNNMLDDLDGKFQSILANNKSDPFIIAVEEELAGVDDVFSELEKRQEQANDDERRAARDISEMRKQLLAEEERDRQRISKIDQQIADQASDILTRISEEAAAVEAAVERFEATGEPTLPPVSLTKAEQQAIDDLNKTIENMKENIQSAVGDTISKALRGDIDDIKDVADTIADIFTDTFATIASELIAAFAIDPIVNQLKSVISKLQGIASEQVGVGAGGGGQTTTGGAIVSGIGAIGAGVGVGYGVSNMAGGGKKGGALGGAAGGAMSGAVIGGMAYGFVGAVVGAAVGAIVGGVAGYLASKDAEKTSLRMQTTAGEPATSENAARGRSPFGIISLFDESMASKEVSNAATIAISEIDAGIAKHLDSRQREIVQNYFQSAVPEGLQVESKNVGDAIAKAVQQRFYHAITALEGEDTAKAVVGELYTATSQNIGAITARAMEALEILATIADFKAGDLSQTAQQIKAINEQFQQLKDRATVLGIPTQDIEAEQQKQLAKITKDFNQDIGDAILGITDPVKLEFVELERMQEERRQNAVDAGADLTELAKLEQLEREELEKKHQGNMTDLVEQGQKAREEATASIFQAIYAIEDPFKAALLGIQQQVAAFQAQADAGLIPQSLVDRFETSATDQAWDNERKRREEEAQVVEDFNQGIYDSLLGMKDANALELQQMDRMHAERYSEAIRLGADLKAVAELNHAERLAKEQEHQDELTALQEQAQRDRENALGNVFMMIWQIEDPFKAVLLGIEQQVNSLQEQVDEGLIPQSLVDRWEDDALAQAYEQEDERRRQAAQSVEDFNNDIAISIAKLTDANRAEEMEMDRIQEDRLRRAEEFGADIAAVEELNRLEDEDRERRHQDEMTRIAEDAQKAIEGATDNIFQAIFSIVGGLQSELYGLLGQIQSFGEQAAQGLISWDAYNMYVDVGINDMLKKDQEQKARAQQDRQRAAQQAADQAKRAQEQRQREAEQRAAQKQREAEQRRRESEQRKREAQQQAEQRKRDAEERKREAEQKKREREQEAERRRQDAMRFNSALLGFTDPAKEAMNQVNEQVREFQAMAKEGIISKKAVDQFKRLSVASAEIDQALQAISGGGGSPIEQVGDAFKQFIEAGSPEKSQSVQAMIKLQEQFSGLAEAAKMLGLSTKDLEKSYLNQAKVIREDAIKAINEEMDKRKDALKQIDDFLGKQRLSDVLPMSMRFNEARAQFGEAVKGGDVDKAVAASEQYLGVAQEQSGTTQQFFSARQEVEGMLTRMRDQQARNIEAERTKLIRQEERQLEQVQIGRSSVDFLRRIAGENSTTSRGVEELIKIARSQTSEQVQTRQLLLRLASKMKA